ncbi:MAG: spiro-SPASM protein [Spirochaetaceae bacterium]|jgi:spiro-SPASM protein|nr:spiro-SPASM protein [Spirochaetaceae bacterium]
MHALTVLYGGALHPLAFKPLYGGQSAFSLALERAGSFPGTEKILVLAEDALDLPEIPGQLLTRQKWTVPDLLRVLSEESSAYDFAYYAWADTPFLDPSLAERIALRHTRFAADYSYADGWPYGLAPELITSSAAGVLCKISGEADAGPVKRDALFGVLQRDINSFDIETEISPVDLRYHRISLSADSRRNFLLLQRFAEARCGGAADAQRIIAEHPEFLRTLPAFFPIQISRPCPPGGGRTGSCGICPYPRLSARNGAAARDFLDPDEFKKLLDKIEEFAGDAVIDLSPWGEPALHPRRDELIRAVLARSAFSLVIESSGAGWDRGTLEALARDAPVKPGSGESRFFSWIVSLNPGDLPRDKSEKTSFVEALVSLFPRKPGEEDRVYVEAVRTAGAEDQIEQFYRAWKSWGAEKNGPGIIIQKYDDFCGFLPRRQGVDLSPVERRPCWHIMRDFPVLIDGAVPVCREDLEGKLGTLGNALKDDLETIWEKGKERYHLHCKKDYGEPGSPCRVCDEYYTFNF